MLFGDLPRVLTKPTEAEMIICTDGIHLKRVDYKLLFPESVVKVEQILTSGTEIAKIGVGNDVFSIYAPTQSENAVTGVRVNGRDVVSNHVADVTIPVTDVKLNGDSVVEGRVAKIDIPDLPEQFVADVVDENDVSLLDENNVAHVTNSGGGHGDVVDVVDQEGTSLLDINKVAHVIGTAPLIIQPTLAYDLATEVTEAQSWTDNTQHQWTAPEDCIIYTPYCSSVGYKFQSDWLWCAGLQYGPFGRNYIPMKKGDTVTILLRSPEANYPHLYYIPYKKAVAIPSELNQPWVDYANSRVVPYTSSITAYDQMLVDFTATSNGILVPALVHSGNREMYVDINDGEFTTYNKYTSNLNFDIFDGFTLSEGDNIKIYFNVNSGTVSGTVKFFPFASETNPSAVYSPIPDWMNYTSADKIMNRDLPATIGRYFWHNQQYSQSGTSGSYPTNFEVDGVSYCVDSRYDYGSTYDFYKSGRLYSSGLETFVTSPSTNQQWILRVALLQAPIEMAELGTYVEGNPADISSDTLTKIKVGDDTYSIRELMNYYYEKGTGGATARPSSPNIEVANRLVYFLATSAMNSDKSLKPGRRDAHILHIPWDGSTALSSQIGITHGDPQLFIRAMDNSQVAAGVWSSWFLIPRARTNGQMTADRVVCTYSDTNLYTHEVTTTELGYLSGTRGNVQNQFDVINTVTDGSAKVDILPNFNTLLISNKYTTATLTSKRFDFSINDTDNTWSSSATIYNATAIDLTDYEYLEVTVNISEQSGYGAFWVTLSDTLYTWAGNRWPTVYANKDSSIKITESGTYTIDVTAYTGSYYIYFGPTTGKDTVTHGDCVNANNGSITGSVTHIKRVHITGYPRQQITRVALFTGGNKTTLPQGYIGLADDITNYDELEFYTVQTPYVSCFKFNVSHFMTNFPYVASPNANTTPHALVFPYSGSFCRIIMGRNNHELYIFINASNAYVSDIYGIKY